MKYYAVTEDPNEMMHWGIKGMKWGVRHDKPRHPGSGRKRSAAYKKAQSKLGKMMKSGIKKAEASWKTYNSPEARYNRQTERAIQLARKGKLKYGKLTDDQVRRVTQRLDLERQARAISNTEPTFRNRLARSISEGVITGVGKGVSTRVGEFVGRRSVLKTERLKAEQNERFEIAKEKRRIKNARKEAEEKIRREFAQDKRKDSYEHERDLAYERERAQNTYLYGAKYDDNGKLTGDSYGTYYANRYDKKRSIQDQAKIEARNNKKEYRSQARRLESIQNRQARIAEKTNKENYRAQVKKLEAAQKAQDEKERERQRKAKAEWAEEIHKKEAKKAAEEAWRQRESRQYVSGQAQNPIISAVEDERQRRLAGASTRKRHGR